MAEPEFVSEAIITQRLEIWRVDCSVCEGQGTIRKLFTKRAQQQCPICKGTGRILETKQISQMCNTVKGEQINVVVHG